MTTFKIVVVSKDSSSKMNPDECIVNTSDVISTSKFIYDNQLGLPEVYNNAIDELKTSNEDFLVLLHGDVKLDIEQLLRHIDSVKSKYDVIGLCGCSKISISQSPLNWFCGSRPYPDCRWGCVTHGELGNKTSYFSQHSPAISDHEVACIDGLCIVMSKHAVEIGLRFDETLAKYDLYDSDISFQAILKYNLKVGVVVRKDLMHYSVGKRIIQPEFLESERKFRDKWKFS